MDSPSAVAGALSAVKGYQDVLDGKADSLSGVSCPDEYTFQVTLDEPFFEFPMMCTLMQAAPVPQAALDDPSTFFHSPIGNGAYKIDGDWVDGQYVNLAAYDGYTGEERPKVGRLHIMIQKDVSTGYREFQGGNVDYCDVPTAEISNIEKEYGLSEDGYTITPGHQLLMGTMPAVSYLVFNLKDPALQDAHLRQAINRNNIVNTVLQGSAAVADNLVPPACQGYRQGQWAYVRYDPDKAKELVAQYYPDGTPELSFLYNADGGHADTVQAIAVVAEDVPYAPLTFSTLRKLGSKRIKEAYVAPNRAQSDASWELAE